MDLSRDYICGLVDAAGSFTFTTDSQRSSIPTFELRMGAKDVKLIEGVRDWLGLKNKIYAYYPEKDEFSKRGQQAMLIIRDVGSLKNIIVPTFYNRLVGYKGEQFNNWLEKIGTDPLVPDSYKIIYRLYRLGFYGK